MMQEFDKEYAEFFYLTSEMLGGMGGIWPLRGGMNRAKSNYHIGPRFIECYSFHFVMEGTVKFVQGENQTELQKGDVFCQFPHIIYEYYTTSPDLELRMFWLAFSEQRIKKIIHLLNLTPQKSYFRINDYFYLNDHLEKICRLLSKLDSTNFKEVIELQSSLYNLFHFLLNHASQDVSIDISDWLQRSKNYLDNHFTENITIKDVAAYAGVHRSYLSKSFSKKFGMPPIQYLQHQRLEKGKKMLESTDYAISEIASSLGYPSLYAFTRAFSNYCKIPPTQYRQMKR
ncbi:AraC family transcriptional regulator [Bacillus sp. J14TS2]|nr:AraC family transcriptional regulator [Bacillus sp. J14TS2]